jgi:hypothetical protein
MVDLPGLVAEIKIIDPAQRAVISMDMKSMQRIRQYQWPDITHTILLCFMVIFCQLSRSAPTNLASILITYQKSCH